MALYCTRKQLAVRLFAIFVGSVVIGFLVFQEFVDDKNDRFSMKKAIHTVNIHRLLGLYPKREGD